MQLMVMRMLMRSMMMRIDHDEGVANADDDVDESSDGGDYNGDAVNAAADDADDASSAHADGDSTANPAPASSIMIVDSEQQRPAIKAFSAGARAHG